MDSFEYKYTETVLKGMTEKEFQDFVKKVFDKSYSPEYLAGIQKLLHIISKQNPNLN
jgi:hypothetical protein